MRNFKDKTVSIIFLLFILVNLAFINRVPGLMGDEGSEGQNVYELLNSDSLPIMGERSYIGVLIDYVRVPFISVLGYTALALRLPVFLFSCGFFWLTWLILKNIFDRFEALFGLVAAVFSPVYLTQQRMGWSITLLPFFISLTIYLLLRKNKWSFLSAGLAAGIGLSTHFIFLPTLLSIITLAMVVSFTNKERMIRLFKEGWTFVIGFWAGFGVQFTILNFFKEDQGSPSEVMAQFSERLRELPTFFLSVISGSVYAAQYTGSVFNKFEVIFFFCAVIFLIAAGMIFSRHRKKILLLAVGLVIHVISLVYITEYFALRYFVVFALVSWLIAGIGFGSVWQKLQITRIEELPVIAIALLLIIFNLNKIFIPFLITGGNTERYDFGTREEQAAALVDLRPLVACLAENKNVYSDDIHIRNRLTYLSNSDKRIKLASSAKKAEFLVGYKTKNSKAKDEEICENLSHFQVYKKPSK